MNSKESQILPLPANITLNPHQIFPITDDLKIVVESETSITDRIKLSLEFFLKIVCQKTGLSVEYSEIVVPIAPDDRKYIKICYEKPISTFTLEDDESYTINITTEVCQISAATDLGVVHSFRTLMQMIHYNPHQKVGCISCGNIEDQPKFSYRGLMIDPVRHFIPIPILKQIIETMGLCKMNTLHLHLTDDQGFRIECKTYPKLHLLGGEGEYYKQTQIKDLIKFASLRGIKVIPEFDMPGHTTSWFLGYPFLGSKNPPVYSSESRFSVEVDKDYIQPTMNPTLESTYEFIEKFWEEMFNLFPIDYFHLGGDEVRNKEWLSNPLIVKYMKEKKLKSYLDLHKYFNQRLVKIFVKHKKTPIGWDDILNRLTEDVQPYFIIESWRQRKKFNSVREHIPTIIAAGYYLDHLQNTPFHYSKSPIVKEKLSPSLFKYIIGGEACMWTEDTTAENINFRIWPRTASIAERFWSKIESEDIDFDDIYRRMDKMQFYFELAGCHYFSNQKMMIRRIFKNQGTHIDSFLKFSDQVLEPVKKYMRRKLSSINKLCPYTRVVDAVLPDSRFRLYLTDKLTIFSKTRKTDIYEELRQKFQQLAKLVKQILPFVKTNPILEELGPFLTKFEDFADRTVEGIFYMCHKCAFNKTNFLEEFNEILKEMETPHAEVEMVLAKPIKELVFFKLGGKKLRKPPRKNLPPPKKMKLSNNSD